MVSSYNYLTLGNRCEPVPYMEHATVDKKTDATNGSTVNYFCQSGYSFNNNAGIYSLSCDGVSWSGRAAFPKCEG